MRKQQETYTGTFGAHDGKRIFLNINALAQGTYELILLNEGKPVRKIVFTKK